MESEQEIIDVEVVESKPQAKERLAGVSFTIPQNMRSQHGEERLAFAVFFQALLDCGDPKYRISRDTLKMLLIGLGLDTRIDPDIVYKPMARRVDFDVDLNTYIPDFSPDAGRSRHGSVVSGVDNKLRRMKKEPLEKKLAYLLEVKNKNENKSRS